MTDARDLPRGTVTFLFTDIEGSTELVKRLGTDAWHEVLVDHAAIIRTHLREHGGTEVRNEGDSFFLAFPEASEAVAAAAVAQRSLADHAFPHGAAPRVRMGLHTGEARPASEEAGTDYVGYAVHKAARIAAAGHGGQVLLSEATRGLVRDALPEGVLLRDLGAHRLKDLAEPEPIYQLVIGGLPDTFPPLRTLDRVPNNLPSQPTTFIGREREIAESRRLLERTRLLTLTGPGGTGKTRLSLQLAAEASDRFADGAFFVPLAPIGDAALVPSAIAQALGVQVGGKITPLQALNEHLRSRRTLLLLDNFEQILPAAPTVGELLKAAPDLKVIVSSRAPLRVYGEQEYPVPPLTLPDARALPPLDAFSHYEAVRLFIERAVAVKPDFMVTNENAPAVAGICARLDGLPLAIELAAARVKILPPQAILDRLEQGLGLLGAGARDLPERQQTLRGAITWSYDLLDEGARRLFERLAVFRGGAMLEQIDAVCGPAEELGCDVLEGVAALVEQSLLRQREVAGEARFQMLVTIREYALERLAARADADTVRSRHTEAYLALAERAAPHLLGGKGKTWLDLLEREHDNLRAAFDWAAAGDRGNLVARLLLAIWRFWQFRGHLQEGRERAEHVLALPSLGSLSSDRAKALEVAGGIAYWQGALLGARTLYEQALAIARASGDPAAVANAAYNLSFTYIVPREGGEIVRELLGEALRLYRELDDRPGIAKSLWALGSALSDQALPLSREPDDRSGAAQPSTLGSARYAKADLMEARPHIAEGLALFRELGDRFGVGWALHYEGMIALRLGETAAARAALDEGLRVFAEARDVSGIAGLLSDLAELAGAEGDRTRAMRLAGAANALTAKGGAGLLDVIAEVEGRDRPLSEADRVAFAGGQSMDADAAVAYALSRDGA